MGRRPRQKESMTPRAAELLAAPIDGSYFLFREARKASMWPLRVRRPKTTVVLAGQKSDAAAAALLIDPNEKSAATVEIKPLPDEGEVRQQSKRAAKTLVAIFFDFVIAASALSVFRGIELMIELYWNWEKPHDMIADDIRAAQEFVAAKAIPIVITLSTEGPFMFGFFPLSYLFQLFHIFLICVFGCYAVYDAVKIQSGR
jgi:hypothetical protein